MSRGPYSISLPRANLLAVALFVPLSALFLVPYASIWGLQKTAADFTLLYEHYMVFGVLIVLGIVLHEFLHGVTWKLAGGKPWSSIKFGFNWRGLAPYAHCREPLNIRAYRWGAAMPGIVLGIIPFLIGLAVGSGWFALFGYLFAITASGDLLILWLIRKIESGTLVQDHPVEAGCEVVESWESNGDSRRENR